MANPPERSRRKSAQVPDEVAAKLEAKVTVELETSDLDEVGQAGTIAPRPPETKVDMPQLERDSQPKVHVATEMRMQMIETIVEMPEHQMGAAVAQREVKTQYVRRINPLRAVAQQPLPERLRGSWLVLLVYLVAIAALALSVYFRFYA